MRRGILFAALTVAMTAPVAPAPAAASPYVVYEIYRVRPGGPSSVPVKIESRPVRESGVFEYLHLAPGEDGGYAVRRAGVLQIGNDGRWRTYGWPVAPPACPAACGSAGGVGVGLLTEFRPSPGDRILVAGARGELKVTVSPPQWRVRATTLGVRVVNGASADATGATFSGYGVEDFRSASAPGGAYGSAAFAQVPCDDGVGAGVATLDAGDGGGPATLSCPVAFSSAFEQTRDGRKWTLSGRVAGLYYFPLRLLVVDYPKRP